MPGGQVHAVTSQPPGYTPGYGAPPGYGASYQMQAMAAPPPIPGCPPGLEYLTQLDTVQIRQKVDILEALTGIEEANRYLILNKLGQQIYFAGEESECCHRYWCGTARGFVYHVTDNAQQEVLRIRRDFECCTGCWCCACDCCHYFAAVEDRNGTVLGYVSNLCFCCTPLFAIYDADKTLVAEIRGPCCPMQNVCCTDPVDFAIVDVASGEQMGTLSKVWEGAIKDMFTNADNYDVSFPIAMDVKKKALMMSAVFIIDMMLYEQKQNN